MHCTLQHVEGLHLESRMHGSFVLGMGWQEYSDLSPQGVVVLLSTDAYNLLQESTRLEEVVRVI